MTARVIRLRRGGARFADYVGLRRALWPMSKPTCAREAREVLARRSWAVFVAIEGDATLGFCEVSLKEYANGASSSPVGFLEGWFVGALHRRRGVGRALVRAAEAWARERGCKELCSDTEVERAWSIAAHRRLGFREAERVVCFVKPLRP